MEIAIQWKVVNGWQVLMQLQRVPLLGLLLFGGEAAESDLERETAGEISELEMCHQMTQSPQSTLFGQICFSINFPSVWTSFSQYADFKIFRGQWLGLTAPKLPWLKSRLWILNLNDFLLNRGLDKRTQFLRGPWVQFSGDSGWLESSRRWIGEWTPWR